MSRTLEKEELFDKTEAEHTEADSSTGRPSDDLVMRAPTFDDLEAVVSFLNAAWGAYVGAEEFNVDETRNQWEEPGFNPQTDIRLLTDRGGKILAYGEFYPREPFVRNFGWVHIHPDDWELSIGQRVLDWLEGRAREAIPNAPEGARVALQAPTASKDIFTAGLLKARGYEIIRRFYRMVIELDGPPQAPAWPVGRDGKTPITVRTMGEGEEVAVIEAVRESFRDHWGFVEQPLEAELERWRHYLADPDFDPSLWFLAEDGGEIAGMSLCRSKFTGYPDMGWVNTLGVLRPWRKKGLATALLLHTFGEYCRRGYRSVGLGVDAQSLTGATRLYEKAGMHVAFEFHAYEKELRPGVELGTMEL
jgi:ribosomal protein S18 acetylase RimI-like enzyme